MLKIYKRTWIYGSMGLGSLARSSKIWLSGWNQKIISGILVSLISLLSLKLIEGTYIVIWTLYITPVNTFLSKNSEFMYFTVEIYIFENMRVLFLFLRIVGYDDKFQVREILINGQFLHNQWSDVCFQ